MFRIMCITDHGNGRFTGRFIPYDDVGNRAWTELIVEGLFLNDRNSGITNTRYSVW